MKLIILLLISAPSFAQQIGLGPTSIVFYGAKPKMVDTVKFTFKERSPLKASLSPPMFTKIEMDSSASELPLEWHSGTLATMTGTPTPNKRDTISMRSNVSLRRSNITYSADPDTIKGKIRTFYYKWSYWNDHGNGWGENTIKLDHYPTRADIHKKMKSEGMKGLLKDYTLYIRELKSKGEETAQFSKDIMDRLPEQHKKKLGL